MDIVFLVLRAIFAGFLCAWATSILILSSLDDTYVPHRYYLNSGACLIYAVAFMIMRTW